MSVLSDEESSFVILGSMPTPSINEYIERMDAAAAGHSSSQQRTTTPQQLNNSVILSNDSSVVNNLTEAMLEMPTAANGSMRSFRTSPLAQDPEAVQVRPSILPIYLIIINHLLYFVRTRE